MRDLTRSCFCCAAICCSGLVSVATSADMYGHEVHLTYSLEGSPLIDDTFIDLGIFVVGEGVEFETVTDFYDYSDPDNPILIGQSTGFVDITHDSIITGRTFENQTNGDYFIYSLPAEFCGWEIEFMNDAPEVGVATLSSMSSGAFYVGEMDLWSGAVEKAVDALYDDPYNPERIQLFEGSTCTIDVQGITWWYTQNATTTTQSIVHLEFACEGDVDSDGSVDIHDLLALVAAWGDCPDPCSADINEDQIVNIHDLLALVAAWGECP